MGYTVEKGGIAVKDAKNNLLILYALCAVFFLAVLCASAIDAPPLLIGADTQMTEEIPMDESLGKVNINVALTEELMTLPGIGEVLAQRIVAYREENGPFERIEDIQNVSGIGEKKFEAIRKFIVV